MAAAKKPRALLVAESGAMRAVLDRIEALADSDEPVLVEGEPGCGREMVARVIHLSSARAGGELASVRAGSMPGEALDCPVRAGVEAAQRSGGSLLLKDVCELGAEQQRRLGELLAREPGPPASGVRVLATTDPGLDAAVEAELFEGELYARLSANTVVVPPLRERVPDIAPLLAHMVAGYGREIGRARVGISTRAYDRLVTYPWPGNVAELKQVARRLVIRARGGRIEAADVDAVLPVIGSRVPLEEMSFEEMVRVKLTEFMRRLGGYPIENLYDDVIGRVERELLELVMAHTGQNQVKAAEILGVSRNTLRRKLAPTRKPALPAKKTPRKGSGRRSKTG